MDGDAHNEHNEDGLSLRSLILPAILVAILNLLFLQHIRNFLGAGLEQQDEKRPRYAAYFAINIFIYIFIAPLFLGTMFTPVLPSVVVASLIGHYISKMFFPVEGKEKRQTSEEENDNNKDPFAQFLKSLGLDRNIKLTLTDGWTIKHLDESEAPASDIINEFFVNISAQDPPSLDRLSGNYNNRTNREGTTAPASSRDILYALTTCCDPILLQDVICKLHGSGNAVPLFVPSQDDTSRVDFYLWGLRETYLSLFDSETKLVQTINATQFPVFTISAIRFGDISVSKSGVLNRLTGENRECFLNYENDPFDTVWSKGTIECDWFLMETSDSVHSANIPCSLFNLRGDGRVFKKQVKLCKKISNILLLFTNSIGNDDLKHFIENETTSAYVILITSSGSEISLESISNLSIVIAKDLDRADVSQAVLDIVRENCANKKGPAIKDMVKLCEELGIDVDEQHHIYQTAKSLAIKTIGKMNDTEQFLKETKFPLQALRKEWIKIDSERIKGDEFESKIAEKLERKEVIRLRQVNTELSDEFRNFLSSLNFDSEQRALYFAWLKILLDQRNDRVLKPVRNDVCSVSCKRKEAPVLMNGNKTQPEAHEREKQQENMSFVEKEFRMKFDECKVGLEHYFSELGQIVECNHQLRDSEVESSSLPETMANVMRNGIPLEIVDSGDCRSLLTYWLGEVFKTLDTICQPQNEVRVVSMVGGPSTYKSTLLNSLFGVNFQVGAGKCSQGVFVKLVPVHNFMRQKLGCGFLLIIDSGSLNTCGGKFSDVIERNNSIATLLSCISDVIILNIGKETSQEEMKNVLEIVARGLVKSKEIKRSAKCCLVKHVDSESGSEYDQDQRTMQLFEKVEQAMKTSTKAGGFDQMYPEIVNSFFLEKDTKNIKFVRSRRVAFPRLLNELYSKDIKDLKYYLLQLIANCNYHAMSYVEFFQRIVDVTSALKTTNFVANFQDTNVENLKDDFIKQYREWMLKIEQELMEKLTIACNEITNSSYESMNGKIVEAKEDVALVTKEKFRGLRQKVEEDIKSSTYKPMHEQLQFFEKDIAKNEEDFLQVIENHLEKTIERAKKFQDRDTKVQNEMEQFLRQISETPILTASSQDELFQTFQGTQGNYVEKLKGKYHSWDFDTIQDRTKSNMNYMLNQCGDKVEELLKNRELTEYAMKRDQGLTMSDIHVIKDKFCISETNEDTVFEEARSDLKRLCDEHFKFETNSAKAIQIFKEVDRKLHSVVESITLFLFLSSKFICDVHRSQLNEEVQFLTNIIQEGNSDSTKVDNSIEHLWQLVDSETYEIQEAEPLKYPNLKSKLKYFLGILRQSISSDKLMALRRVLTIKNINNCHLLPFTLITLQRLDRHFIDMLPQVSQDNMDSIDNVVNEAKMTVMSKAIAKVSLDFGGTFNEIYRMVQLCILDHDQKDQIQAAALVHVSAWSLDMFSIKRYEDEVENNVVNSFQKFNEFYLAAFKTKLNQNCDALVAKIVCDEISKAALAGIDDEIVHRLRASFLTKYNLFNVKRVFIGTILRDLCIHDDYNGFINFLQNFDEFSEKWILKFLASECNKDNDSLLQNIIQNIIEDKMKTVVAAVENISSSHMDESQTFANWLSQLQQNMRICCNAVFQESFIETLKTKIVISDLDHFTRKLITNLKNLSLTPSCPLPRPGSEGDTKIWLLSNGRGIHLELSKLIKGCTTQCPFCGAACEDTLRAHEFHKTALHYPCGVKGWRDTVTDELYVKICTSAIASNATYRTPELNFRPYKDYKIDYPDWDILAKDDQPMEFWKYVFTKFNKNFAKHYKCEKGNVPTEWMSYTKEQAVKSVESAYRLPPL